MKRRLIYLHALFASCTVATLVKLATSYELFLAYTFATTHVADADADADSYLVGARTRVGTLWSQGQKLA
jgi:hypothetical protein